MVLKQAYQPLFLRVVWYHIEDEINPENPPGDSKNLLIEVVLSLQEHLQL